MPTAALAKKTYDPYQPVELGANTSSIQSRTAAVLGTAKPFSGTVWYSQEKFPATQLPEKEGTTGASTSIESPSSSLRSVLPQQELPFSSIHVEPVLVPKPMYSEVPRFVSLQKWECSVLEIGKDSFTARLVDLTHYDTDEEAEFPLEEIPAADLPLLKAGAVFYWNIGYEDSLTGQRTRVSTMRFRRLPVWRQDELDAAKSEARELREAIGWK